MDTSKQTKTASKNGKNQDDVKSRTAERGPKQPNICQNSTPQGKMDKRKPKWTNASHNNKMLAKCLNP